MWDWLKPYLRGAASIIDIGGTMHPTLKDLGIPQNDWEALAQDWAALGQDWGDVTDTVRSLEFRKLLYAVELTETIFGKPVCIYTSYDPEYPEEKWAVLGVKCKKELALEKEKLWCKNMVGGPPFLDIRLSIEVE